VTTVNLNPPAPGEELVRLRNSGNSDELNIDGKSYQPDHRGAFHVPRRHVSRELLTIGAFYPSPLPLTEALQDVASAIIAMPAGREKEALHAALAGLFETVD
jgi:hypothetical protein